MNIIVKNAPTETYYLDLLVPYDSPSKNLGNEEALDAEKLALLKEYNEGGWRSALSYGTFTPMSGGLTGEPGEEGMVHNFHTSLPNDFKIIIVSPDNQVYVSPEIHRNTFKSEITFDYVTHEITQRPLIVSYLLIFASTFLVTILIEGLLLVFFSFSIKRNLKRFMLINLSTQLILTITCGPVILAEGLNSAYLYIFPLEIINLIGKTAAYNKFIKSSDDKRKIAFAVLANLLSFSASLFVLYMQAL